MNRPVHTAAWWCWAGGVAAAGLQTTNLVLAGLLLVVTTAVASVHRAGHRADDPVAAFLRLALVVITVKVVLQAVLAPRAAGTVLVRLPTLTLPDWAAGVRFGGPVTAEGLVAALRTGAQLAVVLVAFGAANAVTSPARLLRLLPGSLYELGVAATVALSTTPQALATARGLRDARRLRGRPTRGLRGMARTAVPTLELTLARSVELAASMDVRGFGRRGPRPAARGAGVLLAVATVLVAVGLYGALAPATPRGVGVLALVGGALAVVAVVRAGRTAVRTRYRPERWTAPSTAVVGSGVAAAVLLWRAGVAAPAVLDPPVDPLGLPRVSIPAAVAVAIVLIPAALPPPGGRGAGAGAP